MVQKTHPKRTDRGAETVPLHHMFVDGEYVPSESGKTFEVENPATGEALALVSEGDGRDIDRAVQAAQNAFATWGKTTGEERADILTRAAQLLAERLEEFVEVEVSQTGRAYREMAAQLARLPEWYSYFGAVARTPEDTVPPVRGGYLNYIPELYSSRSTRRGRTRYAVEPSALDPHKESSACAGGGQHHSSQA